MLYQFRKALVQATKVIVALLDVSLRLPTLPSKHATLCAPDTTLVYGGGKRARRNRYQRRKGSGCNPRPWVLKSGVDMLTQRPNDPICCTTQRVVKTYALEGDRLVETGSRTIASSSDSGLEIVGTVW